MVLPYLVLLTTVFSSSWCVKDVILDVPSYVKAGGDLLIFCNYTLKDEKLYSLKLYLGEKEFLRYIPGEEIPYNYFGIPNQRSAIYDCEPDCVKFSFRGVGNILTGQYTCEVTADEPNFHTVFDQKHVTIVEEPEGNPTILPDKSHYSVEDRVQATCLSRGGSPPPDITWAINDRQISNSSWSWITHSVVKSDVNVSTSVLLLDTYPSLLRNHSLLLRCEATQFNLSSSAELLLTLNGGSRPSLNVAAAIWGACILLAFTSR